MVHDPQRQSPVLSQVLEMSEAHIASLPMHARRKLNRLAIQVTLCLQVAPPGCPGHTAALASPTLSPRTHTSVATQCRGI